MTIALIVGTRPQIIKSVPVVKEAINQGLGVHLIHTGQHYDYSLSKVFFDELSPPEPFLNLNVGSGSHIFQIAEIMVRLEKYLVEEKPKMVLIPGDTNSALAGALASVKLGIPIAHLEAGARSYDMHMAEEINRRLVDHCAKVLFAPTANCKKNLEGELVRGEVFQTGDTMFDVFECFVDKSSKSDVVDKLGLSGREFAVLTTHRAENVDNPLKLEQMFEAIATAPMPVIFPIHPRTKERLRQIGLSLNDSNIRVIDPVGYIEMLALLKHAKIAITDSGGLQKEAFWSKTPCVTIRDRTEWIETVDMGVNFVTDIVPEKIRQTIKYIVENYGEIKGRFASNPYGDGKASERVVNILKEKSNVE
jgi:UDP-N-acetylglucosamine 2-epimerase